MEKTAANIVAPQDSETVEEGVLLVQDKNCRDRWPKREHSIVLENGSTKSYTFHEGKYTQMPSAHAMKFLIDEAFVVCDAPIEDGGKRWRPLPKGKKSDGRFDLQDDELVARFQELTFDALLIRVQAKLGGENFTRQDNKESVIAFLQGRRIEEDKAAKEAKEAENADGVDNLIDGSGEAEMSQEEVDGMFPD